MCRYKLNTEITKHTYINHEGRMDHIVIAQILQMAKTKVQPDMRQYKYICIFK